MKSNEIIRSRRQELGYTLKDIANAVGVSEATVSRWESGDIKNMRRDRVAALSRVLDLPPAVLMDWEEYDIERVERKKLTQELIDLANIAELEHIQIAIDLLKRLEKNKR